MRAEEVGLKYLRKLAKVKRWGFVRTVVVKSLTNYFSVPKRMMHNGTACGLRSFLWDPRFVMPTVASTLRVVEEGFYMEDRDIGEIFLNFLLSEEVRPFFGVGVIRFITEENWVRNRLVGWERWERNIIGLTNYPYHSCQEVTLYKGIDLGDRRDCNNPFNWDRVVVNLPKLEANKYLCANRSSSIRAM